MTDPEPEPPGTFRPMRQVRGHPGVFKRVEVGEPEFDAAVAKLHAKFLREYDAAVAERKAKHNPEGAPQ